MCNISYSLTDGHDVEEANGNQGFLLGELLKGDGAFLSKGAVKRRSNISKINKSGTALLHLQQPMEIAKVREYHSQMV